MVLSNKMSLNLEAHVRQRKSSTNTKSHLKPAKKTRNNYYVFSTNTATYLLVIVWILRTFAPRIRTRTTLIALLIMSKKISNCQPKLYQKLIFGDSDAKLSIWNILQSQILENHLPKLQDHFQILLLLRNSYFWASATDYIFRCETVRINRRIFVCMLIQNKYS